MRDVCTLGIRSKGKAVTRPEPDATGVAEFERRLGAQLPEDYKAFLRVANGGCPAVNWLETRAGPFQIEAFYSLSPDQEDHYSVSRASRWPARDLGRKVVAVAGDGSGDQLLLDYVSDPPIVSWWQHDHGKNEQPIPIAPNFSDFLDLLVVPPPDARGDAEGE